MVWLANVANVLLIASLGGIGYAIVSQLLQAGL